MEDIEKHPVHDDYVYVTLLDDNPVLYPMEKVRAVYPNAMHVERKTILNREGATGVSGEESKSVEQRRREADPTVLFAAFYQEVKGEELSQEKQELFASALQELLAEEGEAI